MTKVDRHYVFDAFGTLFDVHSVAREQAEAIGPNWARLSEIWRTKQLEYTWINAGLGRHVPFQDLTRQALHYALSVTGLDAALAPRLLESYGRLAPFAEVGGVLRSLRSEGAKLAILSNGDSDMLDRLVLNAGFADLFDARITVAAAGTFKPAPRVYQLACDVFRVPAGAITFLSSNRWDVAGAAAFGFKTIWVNRTGAPDEYPDLPPARVVADLTPLCG